MKLSEKLSNYSPWAKAPELFMEHIKEAQALEARVSCMEHEMNDHKMKAGEDGDIVRLVLEIPRATDVSKAMSMITNTLQLWLTKAPETFRKKV